MKKLLWIFKAKIFLFVLTFSMNAAAKIHEVQVSNFMFDPSVLSSVEVGDTVRWVWLNGSHTTTSVSIPAGAAAWDVPLNSTSTSFDYQVKVVGEYSYKCAPHASMGMTGSFTASFPSGINMDRSMAEILIYPNPASSNLNIRYRSADAPLQTVSIYDISGKKMKEMYVGASGPLSNVVLNMADLGKGILLVELKDRYGRNAVRRIVKN